MATPSTLQFTLTQNQYNTWAYLRDDITDVTNWDAAMEWRATPDSAESPALVTLTPGSGLTMTAGTADGLRVDIVLSETQSDTLAGAARVVYSSLKLINASGVSEQQFVGQYTILKTPTE